MHYETSICEKIHIRSAQQSDIPILVQMARELTCHHGDTPLVDESTLQRDVFTAEPWLRVMIAEVAGKVAGYTALCHAVILHFGKRGLDMHHLYVAQDFRGLGVGTSLIEATKSKAIALDCQYIILTTDPENLAAQSFYKRRGFEPKDTYPPRFMFSL